MADKAYDKKLVSDDKYIHVALIRYSVKERKVLFKSKEFEESIIKSHENGNELKVLPFESRDKTFYNIHFLEKLNNEKNIV